MLYTVYKITNLINSKIYVGVHRTDNLDDKYMGSSKILKNAIRKYGRGNFLKEIIAVFDNEFDMFDMERNIVNEEFVARSDTYNSKTGGFGIGYFNKDNARRCSEKSKLRWKEIIANDPDAKRRANQKVSQSLKGRPCYHWIGRTHKNETIEKMKASHIGKHTGSKNSQFGSCWITNGTENKKISASEEIPNGWRKGRIINRA